LYNLIMKLLRIPIYIIAILLFSSAVYADDVEGIDNSDIPAAIEKAIELKKADNFKVIPIIDMTLLGTVSKLGGGDTIGGVDAKATVAPAMRLDENNYIIPLYYGSYNRERQVITEEEGGRVYNEVMDQNATFEYKHIYQGNTTFKTDGFMRLHYVKEKGYKWGSGLYDYRDFGAGFDVEHYIEKTKQKKIAVSLGGEYYHRKYPNYQSLLSLATVTAPEKDEKDYNGYRPILKYKYITPNLNSALMYSPLYKDFIDKKVINSNGVLEDDRREDWFHLVNINLTYLPSAFPVAPGLGLTGIIVDSNQNYYDSSGTVTLLDDTATKHYYSFMSLNVNPRLTYIHKLKDKNKPATVTLGYAYLVRDYSDRKAQKADGTYTDDNERDQTHTIRLQATYPLSKNVSAVATAQYVKAKSNMKYETYYLYGYESYIGAAGIRAKF